MAHLRDFGQQVPRVQDAQADARVDREIRYPCLRHAHHLGLLPDCAKGGQGSQVVHGPCEGEREKESEVRIEKDSEKEDPDLGGGGAGST